MKVLQHLVISMSVASVLSAQSLQEIASSLPAPVLDAAGRRLELPQVEGAQVELGGVDYEQLVDEQD